jgi:hypothetical protein
MLFLKAFVVGFGTMLGIEIALGLCMAVKQVKKGKK